MYYYFEVSQRKFAGAATCLSTYKKGWGKKYPVSPGLTTHGLDATYVCAT